MKKIVISLLLSTFVISVTTFCSAQEQLELVPPAQGGSERIAQPDQVKEDTSGKITAATPQDAANAAVGKLTQVDGGVKRIAVGSGTGYVAVGNGAYRTNKANPVAVRTARRNAAIKAYLGAQKNLAEFLRSTEVNQETVVEEVSDVINDGNRADGSLLNSSATTEEKVSIAIDTILGAYVLYNVDWITARGGAGEVNVSIIVTPKTIKGVAQINAEKTVIFDAQNTEAGAAVVEKEIQSMLQQGLFFPTGGKQIYVRATGEFVFLGYAAVPINVNSGWLAVQQRRQKINALTSAEVNAKAQLVSMIQGNKISYNYIDFASTKEDFSQFERDKQTGELKVFDEAQNSFVARNQTTEFFRSVIRGICPPGVTPKSFYFDDDSDGTDDWAVSIAVYIPSVGVETREINRNIRGALRGNKPGRPRSTNRALPPAGELPSGQTTSDDDL